LNWQGDGFEEGFLQFLREGVEDLWFQDVISNKLQGCYRIKFVNAAAWFIPSFILKKVGGFDPIFPQYAEDNDFVNRLHYHGYEVGICSYSFIKHYSNFKNWRKIQYDQYRQIIIHLCDLKNINASLKSNLFFLVKRELDSFFTNIILLKWKDAIFRFKLLFLIIPKIPQIILSRKISHNPKSFL
jgi:GT2 family glycosyltransferase